MVSIVQGKDLLTEKECSCLRLTSLTGRFTFVISCEYISNYLNDLNYCFGIPIYLRR
jgi:hypothetical protein